MCSAMYCAVYDLLQSAEMQTLRGSVRFSQAVCGRIASCDADTVTTTSLVLNVLCNVLCCL